MLKQPRTLIPMLLLLLFSCTDDTVKEPALPEPDTTGSPGKTINAPMGATTGEQIPDIVKELERLTGKRAGSASKGMDLEDVVIDFSNIRWIIGQGTGRTNYTFPILVKGRGMDAFYNLIVVVEADGEILPPVVREYRVAPDAMEGFRASGYDFAEFRGTVRDHGFEDFFNASFDLDLLAKSPGCPPAPIGSQSENPVHSPDLIVVDEHQNWSGGGGSHPMGQVSFDADAYTGALHNALVYVNTMIDGQNHTRYQETVTTYSEGVVNVGTSAINAPVLGNFFAGPPTVTGVTVTVSGVGSQEDGNYCVTYVVETTHYSNGYVQNRTIYSGVCTDSPAPDQKSGMAGRSTEDCPGGGDGAIVLVPYELVVIQDKLCLPEEGQAYAFLMENGLERHQLYTYLEDQNVPDDCTDDSPARLFALQAAMAMAEGAEVDFEEGIIVKISDECQEEIIIEGLDNCSALSALVLGLFGGNYDIDYLIEQANLDSNITASTSNMIHYNSITKSCFVRTRMDVNYLNSATDLSIARTIAHESLHAALTFMAFEGMFIYNGTIDSNFGNLMNGFIEYLETNINDQFEGAQHEILIELVGEIASSLQNFGVQNGYNLPSSYYMDLAWGGLTHIKDNTGNITINPMFIAAVPNINDRTRIMNTIVSEATNTYQGNINPKGTSCE